MRPHSTRLHYVLPQKRRSSHLTSTVAASQRCTRRPEDTAWEDGTFKLSVDFSEEYPNKAPTVKFITKMFHPNSKR